MITTRRSAAVFVAAWIAGLLLAPAAPDPDASDAAIRAFYAAHGTATSVQSLLIHGIAGVALVFLALGLADGWGRIAGLAAAAVSLVQCAIGLALAHGLDPAGFDALNVADTVKLALLGVFIWSASRTRLRTFGALAAVLQPVAGLAFLTGSSALYGLLYVALPVLLAWVAVAAYRSEASGSRIAFVSGARL